MSYQATNWAVGQTAGSPGHKAVLMALANRAGVEDWSCCVSQKLLAAETEQSISTVGRQLGDLETLGLIARQERRRKDGSRTTDRFQLLSTPPRQIDEAPRSQVTYPPVTCDRAIGTGLEEVPITTADVFTTREDESVEDSLSLDEARRRLREGWSEARIERKRLQEADARGRDP